MTSAKKLGKAHMKRKKSPPEVRSQEQATFLVLSHGSVIFFLANMLERLQFNGRVMASSEPCTVV